MRKMCVTALLMLSMLFATPLSSAIPSNQPTVTNATWYARGGKVTASGERFDPEAMTAAHRSIKFGTKVKVTNIKNGKTVIVIINDRMPPNNLGRHLDLTRGAARKIMNLSQGVVQVRYNIV